MLRHRGSVRILSTLYYIYDVTTSPYINIMGIDIEIYDEWIIIFKRKRAVQIIHFKKCSLVNKNKDETLR